MDRETAVYMRKRLYVTVKHLELLMIMEKVVFPVSPSLETLLISGVGSLLTSCCLRSISLSV